jgi:hypothetical protein
MDRLHRRARLAQDLDVALGLKQLVPTAADDLVVVEQENSDGWCSAPLPGENRCRAPM